MDGRRSRHQLCELRLVLHLTCRAPARLVSSLIVVGAMSACGADAPQSRAPVIATAPPRAVATNNRPAVPRPAVTPPPVVAPPPAPPPKMNVIVLMVDSMRADMPWQGYDRPIAPNLTKLAAQSVSYSRAYSLSSYTAMSVGGFLAGRYPGELKRSGYFFSSHPDEEIFFPELLQEAGVRTLAAHAHFYFKPEKAGFHQGFDDYRLVEGLSADNSTDDDICSCGAGFR